MAVVVIEMLMAVVVVADGCVHFVQTCAWKKNTTSLTNPCE